MEKLNIGRAADITLVLLALAFLLLIPNFPVAIFLGVGLFLYFLLTSKAHFRMILEDNL